MLIIWAAHCKKLCFVPRDLRGSIVRSSQRDKHSQGWVFKQSNALLSRYITPVVVVHGSDDYLKNSAETTPSQEHHGRVQRGLVFLNCCDPQRSIHYQVTRRILFETDNAAFQTSTGDLSALPWLGGLTSACVGGNYRRESGRLCKYIYSLSSLASNLRFKPQGHFAAMRQKHLQCQCSSNKPPLLIACVPFFHFSQLSGTDLSFDLGIPGKASFTHCPRLVLETLCENFA